MLSLRILGCHIQIKNVPPERRLKPKESEFPYSKDLGQEQGVVSQAYNACC
jgi:hypothetical protein